MVFDVSSLNPPQREAVLHDEGALLVLAGAGSGKTRVVTMRIARLLREGHDPRGILAVTFTNKAAKEMRERVGPLCARPPRGLSVSTFHSLCARILRSDAHRIGISGGFTILDSADQLAQLLRVARDESIDLEDAKPPLILSRIGAFKNQGLRPDDTLPAKDDLDRLAARLYPPFAAHLRQLDAVDFDDLLLLARDLLETIRDVRERYQHRLRFLMIDEYQDTNPLQLELVRLLAGPRQNICAVGDDDQAIYGFRGGCVENILNFDQQFAPCKVIKLEQNYRSTSAILNAANAVIANNRGRKDKTLFSALGDGEMPKIKGCADGEAEAETVARMILEEMKHKRPLGDIALLYRANPQSRAFEEQLRLNDIPYHVVGGQEFYERKEVKDALAYLTLLVRPSDELAYRRVVNLPARGLGEKAVAAAIENARRHERSFIEDGALGAPGADLPEKSRKALVGFCRPLQRAQEELEGADLEDDLSDICARAMYSAGIEALLGKEKDLKRRERISESVEEVIRGLFAWTGRLLDARENPDLAESWVVDVNAHPVSSFLDRVALEEEEREKARQKRRENEGQQKKDDRVTLMSLHRSKGLEFPVVFMVGFEEGLLPHRRALEEDGGDAIEEERRLCYVGITRAQRRLTFTYAKARRRRKQMVPRRLSRFAEELPDGVRPKEVVLPDQETAAAGFFEQMRGQFKN